MSATSAFRNKLKALVDSGELSISTLKIDSGISRSSVYGWIDGKNAPNLEQMERLAKAAKKSVREMLSEEGDAEADRLACISSIFKLHPDDLTIARDFLALTVDNRTKPVDDKLKKSSS